MKLKILPSFFILCLLSLLSFKALLLACYTLAMLLHECAHLYVARRKFYRCDKLCLSAFGAVLYGDFDKTDNQDVSIALAGPALSLCVALAIVATWWLYPPLYVYTEAFFLANLSLGLVNLLPCYPLDGGKVCLSLLQKKYSAEKSLACVKTIAVVLSLAVFAMFILSVFLRSTAYSLGVFACFLIYCSLCEEGASFYRCGAQSLLRQRGKEGMEKKTLVFSECATLKSVFKRLKGGYLYQIEIVDEKMCVLKSYNSVEMDVFFLAFPLTMQLCELYNGDSS